MENIENNNEIEIIKETIEEIEPVEGEVVDKYTLKVKGGDPRSPDPARKPTDPVGLSRSILHVLESNPHGYCKINSVGPIALAAACAGFRLASISYTARTKGSTLVMNQSEYTATVAGNKTRGICTRIFPIPVSHQL